jgi:hypothetical protein
LSAAAPIMQPQPQAVRREPAMDEYQPQAAPVVQPASAGEQTGLEIPAFLRRQHSH